MSHVDSSSRSPKSDSKSIHINGDDVALASTRAIDLHEDGRVFEMPARLFEQLPFAIYICDVRGRLVRYNRRAAELWGQSPQLNDPNQLFCGSYLMFRADGSPMPHSECYMADVLRDGISIRKQEIQVAHRDGRRGWALVDIEAIRDRDGNIIGAINCFQDISERKAEEAREKMFASEMEHRVKNLISLVQATVSM